MSLYLGVLAQDHQSWVCTSRFVPFPSLTHLTPTSTGPGAGVIRFVSRRLSKVIRSGTWVRGSELVCISTRSCWRLQASSPLPPPRTAGLRSCSFFFPSLPYPSWFFCLLVCLSLLVCGRCSLVPGVGLAGGHPLPRVRPFSSSRVAGRWSGVARPTFSHSGI